MITETCIYKEITERKRSNEDIVEQGTDETECKKECGRWFACHGIVSHNLDEFERNVGIKDL